MNIVVKETGLGKGVGLLFGDSEDEDEKYFLCDIDKIIPNQLQPRSIFKEDDLVDLSNSIRENGIIQPLIVKQSVNGSYELIAGERRLRASKIVGLDQVPVVVNDVDDDNILLEMALVENIQRTDLNPIEEAEAYHKLIERFGYTQEQTAKRVGKTRSTVTNLLRLLNLPDFIKEDLINNVLSEGHARSLLRLGDDTLKIKEARNQIVNNKLSVRQTEQLVKKLKLDKVKTTRVSVGQQSNELPKEYCLALSNQLTNKINSKVAILQNGSRGKIEIEYYSSDDLERVIGMLTNEQEIV